MKFRSLLAAALLLGASSASHAALILTLQHDGAGGVIASVTGSGLISDANLPGPEPRNRLLVDDIGPGSPFNANLNFVGFGLANPLSFAPGIDIVSLILDDDAGAGIDDIFLPLSGDLTPTPIAYNAAGTSVVNGLSFSDLTVGTYSNPNYPVARELGGFTLIIADVPEPASVALLALGLVALRRTRRPSA